ncbi:hypothetical protein GBA52_028810 [Prunus armeniaca]|nr:hypothetical protein GBA52_028810 [Prunus armeniaca]
MPSTERVGSAAAGLASLSSSLVESLSSIIRVGVRSSRSVSSDVTLEPLLGFRAWGNCLDPTAEI